MLCAYNLRPANYRHLNWKMVEPDAEGYIYWHIVNFTPDQPKEKTILAFTRAFEIWQEAFDRIPPVGRVIKFKATEDYHKAHVTMFFMNPNTKKQVYTVSDGSKVTVTNNWPFDGPQGVLAHRVPNSFQLHFDEGEKWSDIHKYEKEGSKWTLFVELMAVVLHELGHMWDLDHTSVKGAVMEGMYDAKHTTISNDDQAGLNAKWGSVKKKIAARLAKNKPAPVESPNYDSSYLVANALRFYGLKEIAGPGSDTTILAWIKEMFPNANDDSAVAWCSIYMNAIAKVSGYEYTNSGLAKSWLKVGLEIPFEDRQLGDVAIFHRGSNPALGHVALYLNDYNDSMIRVLGGNQDDAVNIRAYASNRIAGFRRLKKIR